MHEVFLALALCLIFEGALFALSPARLRKAMLVINQISDQTLRLCGAFALSTGLLLYLLISKF
jgi:uncharacterized protein YjeT (DUF2065 family)